MTDYISREAAIEAITEVATNSDRSAVFVVWPICGEVEENIKSIPAADVRPVVKAQWNVGADGWECSNCTIESNNTYPICPYCGADMRGDNNE